MGAVDPPAHPHTEHEPADAVLRLTGDLAGRHREVFTRAEVADVVRSSFEELGRARSTDYLPVLTRHQAEHRLADDQSCKMEAATR